MARRVLRKHGLPRPVGGQTRRVGDRPQVPLRAPEKDEEGIVAQTTQTYNGYCVKCKEKRDFEGNVEVSKTGMKMAKGKCPVCGTTVNRILGKA